VPGTPALNLGNYAWTISVSCASPGQCAAGGRYLDQADKNQAFIDSQT